MNSAVKLIIGIIVFLIGIVWYAAPLMGQTGLQNALGHSTFDSFKVVFAGLFGLALLFFGLIVAWIEYEDIKWERKEKKEKKPEKKK